VPPLQGVAAVIEQHSDDERLRRSFQALAPSKARPCSPEDLDRVWAAVRGELPAAERRALVERLADDPAIAEAWRVAHTLRRDDPWVPAVESRRSTPVVGRWLATAAVALLAVSAVLVVSRLDRSNGDTMRTPGGTRIEALIASDAAMSRDAFRLRWTPGPVGSRYQVRVTTEDLQVLTTIANLAEPEVTIDPAVLAGLTPGTPVLWQVEATGPGGERTVSQTFATRLQ
jgi:hypothetical protein